ncbi:MAG: transcription factor [Candidatus Nezhaarchaeales archaeon]
MAGVVSEIAGKDAAKVALTLLNNAWSTDEKIAEITQLKLNDVRRILYSLLDRQIVMYKKNRDENIGWYTYYWAIDKDNLEHLALLRKRQALLRLKLRLDYEKSHVFFKCINGCGNRLTFEDAMESYFKCPQCGHQLDESNNLKIIQVLERKIKILEEQLEAEEKLRGISV